MKLKTIDTTWLLMANSSGKQRAQGQHLNPQWKELEEIVLRILFVVVTILPILRVKTKRMLFSTIGTRPDERKREEFTNLGCCNSERNIFSLSSVTFEPS